MSYRYDPIFANAYTGGYNRTSDWPLDKMLIKGPSELNKLIKNGMRYKGDNGAFVVITENQYIIGINGWEGAGPHMHSYAKVHEALLGNPDRMLTSNEIADLSETMEKTFITINIEAEELLNPNNSSLTRVFLPRRMISPKEMETFNNFYKDYGRFIDSKLAIPLLVNIEKNGTKVWKEVKGLFGLSLFLKPIVSEDVIVPSLPKEEIIGVATPRQEIAEIEDTSSKRK